MKVCVYCKWGVNHKSEKAFIILDYTQILYDYHKKNEKKTPVTNKIQTNNNKKVLLRERKRHTDRRVGSPGGGVDRQNHRHTDTCENITYPHPSDAVGNNYFILNCHVQIKMLLERNNP